MIFAASYFILLEADRFYTGGSRMPQLLRGSLGRSHAYLPRKERSGLMRLQRGVRYSVWLGSNGTRYSILLLYCFTGQNE